MSPWTDHALLLPRPGPLWGPYPQRDPADQAGPWRRPRLRTPRRQAAWVARQAVAAQAAWAALDEAARAAALAALRQRLRREGLAGAALAQALGAACAEAGRSLGLQPRHNQRLAAAALLGGQMAEMATGEGKTLAVALAAAVAALAGMPVHVVTANAYLAQRDAQAMAPLYAALGLRVAALGDDADEAAKPALYAHDIVCTTAKALAFDHLRDRQALAAAGPAATLPTRLRGLCMALLDEADSILLDEAQMPLVLARCVPQPARRAQLWQALALARQLQPGRDFELLAEDRRVRLGEQGEATAALLCAGLGGAWARPRYRREALTLALVALHAMQPELHYLVRDGRVEVLDEVSGRAAPGRAWSRGLHTLLALKEGLAAPDETETAAQTSFQRFFQRYWRLGGISGTLCEAAAELRRVYGCGVLRVPPHRPSRRRTHKPRCFDDAAARDRAVLERVAALQAQGRPVLVGTDGLAASRRLSALLGRHGIAHQVLDALHAADEAAVVAAAGRAGCVTVATRMAGRGTDIALDDAARAAGGLHVLCCQDNPSRRLDRQLAGRAGRQGDPGSFELWLCREPSPGGDGAATAPAFSVARALPWVLPLLRRWRQWWHERHQAARRAHLLQQDLEWERRLSFAGTAD